MQDVIVIDNLRRRGFDFSNINESLRYEAPERMSRVLDKAPKRLTVTKVKDIPIYGCKAEFIMTYNDLKEKANGEVFTLDFKGKVRYCDKGVFVVLQALIVSGMTCSKERAEACFELFRIISMIPAETITVGKVYEVLTAYCDSLDKNAAYYVLELQAGISQCIFRDQEAVLYYNKMIEFNGFYKQAYMLGRELIKANCKSKKDVQGFLLGFYKEAKKDTAFMKNIYKPGANKWLIATIYALKDSNPEILEPSKSSKGFA